MRNFGIIILLVIFGMSIWRASDRNQPIIPVPTVSEASQKPVEVDIEQEPEKNPEPAPVETESPLPKEPNQPQASSDPVAAELNARAVKPRQKPLPADQPDKSFERIVIPSLKINAPVIPKPYSELSWDLTNLGQDVALLGDIPNQTAANNVVMAGHVTVFDGSNGPFRYLWKLAPGDQIMLEEGNTSFTYVVRDQFLVYPEDSAVLEDSQTPQLTLITCTTWDEETLSYLRRRVIVADLVDVEYQQVFME